MFSRLIGALAVLLLFLLLLTLFQEQTPPAASDPGPRPSYFSFSSEPVAAPRQLSPTHPAPGSMARSYRPGVLLVRFNEDVTQPEIDAEIAAVGADVEAYLPRLRVFTLRLPPGARPREVRQRLEQGGKTALVERDLIVSRTRLPNDPYFSLQWGLHTPQSGDVRDADIDAADAWDLHRGSRRVAVMVIDGGIDVDHPDLSPNLWVNEREIPGNFVDDDGNGYVDDRHGINTTFSLQASAITDFDGHGSHVAGAIAARGNNGIGVTGVAWHAELVTCRAFWADGTAGLSAILGCFEYAEVLKEAGVNLVATNNSWGGYGEAPLLMHDAIDRHAELGILAIAAAGNAAVDTDVYPHFPSSMPQRNIISVAASDETGGLAFFSNYGASTVDIAAPGLNMLSTFKNGDYAYLSGTSMATPIVTGAVALIASSDANLTTTQVKEHLLEAATEDSRMTDITVTGGRLHVSIPLQDADNDQMADEWEIAKGLNPLDANDADRDPDDDGLSNLEEFYRRTEPQKADTDGDGLSDGAEVATHGTDPLNPDTDSDGLSDGHEVSTSRTSPLSADTDGDGLGDQHEAAAGTNALDADSDDDGIADGWEVDNGQNPLAGGDAGIDSDGDGLSAAEEYAAGTDPNRADSDDDGLTDGAEVGIHGSSPTHWDSDEDGVPDGWEVLYGSDPLLANEDADADEDGFDLHAEYRARSDPTDALDKPVVGVWGMQQGAASGAGFVEAPTRGAARWQRWMLDTDHFPGRPLVFADEFFLATGSALVARSLLDGRERWRSSDDGAPSSATASGERIYYRPESTRVTAMDRVTRSEVWERTYEQAFTTDFAILGDALYALQHDHIVALDAANGEVLWRVPLPGTFSSLRAVNQTTPVAADDWVAAFLNQTLTVFDRNDGSIRFSGQVSQCLGDSRAVLTADAEARVFVEYNECVAGFDVAAEALRWDISSRNGHEVRPAVDNDFYYTMSRAGGDALVALDKETGAVAWRYVLPNFAVPERYHNLLVTLDHVFIVTVQGTVAFNLSEHVFDWYHPLTGFLAVGPDGGLLVNGRNAAASIELSPRPDIDGDGLPAYAERLLGLDPVNGADGAGDLDGDGLSNSREFAVRSHPAIADTDGDGLDDGTEVLSYETDPLREDTDQDGLTDAVEVNAHGTHPLRVDTDGDGADDAAELQIHGTSPTDPTDHPAGLRIMRESFENGLPAGWRTPAGSDGTWFVTRDVSVHGPSSLRTPALESASIEWEATFVAGEMRFKALREPATDSGSFNVFIDDQWAATVEGQGWRTHGFHVPAGTHTIRFEFRARGDPVNGPSFVAIDALEFRPAPLFSAQPGNVLALNDIKLMEYARDGELVRAGVVPGYFTDYTAFEQLPDHRLALSARRRLVLFDPLNERAVDVPSPMTFGSLGMAVIGDYLYLTDQNYWFGSIARFDLQGRFLHASIRGTDAPSRYIDLAAGSDGFLYALLDQQGRVHKLDPETLELVGRLDFDCHQCDGLTIDAAGRVHMVDGAGRVLRFNATQTVAAAVTADGYVLSDLDVAADGRMAVGAHGGDVGAVAPDLLSADMFDIPDLYYIPTQVRVAETGGLDSDADGLPDWWERFFGLDRENAADAGSDRDSDGLTAAQEYAAGSLPDDADSDDDGLTDGVEVGTHRTDPRHEDTDRDGLPDAQELADGTNPTLPDSDGDGLVDGEETLWLANPLDPDTDGDGALDGWEAAQRLDPSTEVDADGDTDGDGLSQIQEHDLGTDPNDADTDRDGLSDGAEVNVYGSDPLARDSDGDRIDDGWEVAQGLELLVADGAEDTDGDGFSNLEEAFAETAALDAADTPQLVPWSGFQGTLLNRGFAPLHLRGKLFQEAWRRQLDAPFIRLNGLAVAEGRVFATMYFGDSGRIQVLDAASGDNLWLRNMADRRWVSPPSIDGDRVYVQTGNRSETRAYAVSDGRFVLNEPYNASIADPNSPVVFGESLYVPTGAHLSRLDKRTGAQQWSVALDTRHRDVSPVVTNASVYLVTYEKNGHFTAIDREEGTIRYAVRDPDWEQAAPWILFRNAPLLGRRDNLIISTQGNLKAFNVERKTFDWNLDGIFGLHASWGNGRVYVVEGGDVLAVDAATGERLWRWNPPRPIQYPILVLADRLLVATDKKTHMLDIETQTTVWEYPLAGHLSVDEDGALYIANPDGAIAALRLVDDEDEDGLPDSWESANGLNPADSSDATLDSDNDGLTNREEYQQGTVPGLSDSDDDGMADGWEVRNNLDPRDSSDAALDEDGDGLANLGEWQAGSDPGRRDSDGDGLTDGWEVVNGLDPIDATDARTDADGDGLDNTFERSLGTDPQRWDTDGDSLSDGWEHENGLDPLVPTDADSDVDADGLNLLEEIQAGTDPLRRDTDGDGLSDGAEVAAGLSPTQRDTDGDGLDDGWESWRGLDPLDPGDANGDPDGDGLDNTAEAGLGTHPMLADTDDDGLRDDRELTLGTSPTRSDTDGDTMPDGYEIENGFDPLDFRDCPPSFCKEEGRGSVLRILLELLRGGS